MRGLLEADPIEHLLHLHRVGPDAQAYFANGNNEWPTAKGVKVNNPALQAMSGTANGNFKAETIPLSAVGAHTVKVQQMLDRGGFK